VISPSPLINYDDSEKYLSFHPSTSLLLLDDFPVNVLIPQLFSEGLKFIVQLKDVIQVDGFWTKLLRQFNISNFRVDSQKMKL